MSDTETESKVIEGEIVPYYPPAPVTLFGSTDPEEVLDLASKRAKALARIIDQQGLYTLFADGKGGKKAYVHVEAWQTLGGMTGVFAVAEGEPEWVELDGQVGFKSTYVAIRNGEVIGRATGYCMKDEPNRKGSPLYALSSMAQTRAISRALRGPLGWIMKLAGYETTSAEEMVSVKNEGPAPSATGTDTKLATEPQLKRLFALCSALDKKGVASPSEEKWEDYVKTYCRDTWGLESRRQLTRGQVQFLFEHLEGGVPF